MTEAEWLACGKPDKLLKFLGGVVSERKLRLFGCSCCRVIWPLFTDERSRSAVEVVERYADRAATSQEMAIAQQAASDARDLAFGPSSNAPRKHRSRTGLCTSWAAYALTNVPPDGSDIQEVVLGDVMESISYARDIRGLVRRSTANQTALLRDIVANPFRSLPPIQTAWLRWNHSTIKRLAEAIYEERSQPDGHLDVARLGVLPDALEEAGCTDTELLGHLGLMLEGATRSISYWTRFSRVRGLASHLFRAALRPRLGLILTVLAAIGLVESAVCWLCQTVCHCRREFLKVVMGRGISAFEEMSSLLTVSAMFFRRLTAIEGSWK